MDRINVTINGSTNNSSTSMYKSLILKGNYDFSSLIVSPFYKYIIKNNFDLNGLSVLIPNNCILEFDGGSLNNGTLIGNNTILIYYLEETDILRDITLEGSFIRKNGAGIPDEEDITLNSNNKLLLKDRTNDNGMGYVILRNDKSIPELIIFNNTVYSIRYNFILNEDFSIPENCVLKFEGGSISSEEKVTITGNNTTILYYQPLGKIFNNIIFDGTIIYKDCGDTSVKEVLYGNGEEYYEDITEFNIDLPKYTSYEGENVTLPEGYTIIALDNFDETGLLLLSTLAEFKDSFEFTRIGYNTPNPIIGYTLTKTYHSLRFTKDYNGKLVIAKKVQNLGLIQKVLELEDKIEAINSKPDDSNVIKNNTIQATGNANENILLKNNSNDNLSNSIQNYKTYQLSANIYNFGNNDIENAHDYIRIYHRYANDSVSPGLKFYSGLIEVTKSIVNVHIYNDINNPNTASRTSYRIDPLINGNIIIKIVVKEDMSKAKIIIVNNGVTQEINNVNLMMNNGDIRAFCKANTGTIINNIVFSFSCEKYSGDTWIYGDSYVYAKASLLDKWTAYLLKNGYNNFVVNAYSGESSTYALTDLKNNLEHGTPKRIIWALGMNDSDCFGNGTSLPEDKENSNWYSALDNVKLLCEKEGIELILCTIPTVSEISNGTSRVRIHEYKNRIVRNSGLRYIDFDRAVNANNITGLWDTGLRPDGNVHPNEAGALVLYNRAVADVPELTGYEPEIHEDETPVSLFSIPDEVNITNSDINDLVDRMTYDVSNNFANLKTYRLLRSEEGNVVTERMRKVYSIPAEIYISDPKKRIISFDAHVTAEFSEIVDGVARAPYILHIDIYDNNLIFNLIPNVRHYTYGAYKDENGNTTEIGMFFTPTGKRRLLTIDGLINTRDIGAIDSKYGTIKYNRILRGSSYSNVLERGSKAFKDMNLSKVIDLEKAPYLIDNNHMYSNAINISGSDLNFCTAIIKAFADITDCIQQYVSGYRKCVYVNCIDGETKTGMLITLLLGMLGVSEQDILKETDISIYYNSYLGVQNESKDSQLKVVAQFIDNIKNNYGNHTSFETGCIEFIRHCALYSEPISNFNDITYINNFRNNMLDTTNGSTPLIDLITPSVL